MRGRFIRIFLVLLLCSWQTLHAQEYLRKYSVKEGKMYIVLGKNLPEAILDSFIIQFDLHHLALKRFIQSGFADSIHQNGWEIAMNEKVGFMITKPMQSFNNINNSADRIIFMGNNPPFNALFPAVSNSVRYGYNRFRNKSAFAIKDSMVMFFHRFDRGVNRVMLAGSFNDWNPDQLQMIKTDSGWVLPVKLKPGKYWYKFILDGNWTTDRDNRLSENDGLGNVNSVFYVPNELFKLDGYQSAKKVILAGSFNEWNETELQMQPSATGWQLPVYLADGTHTYRFIIDKNWISDPSNPDRFPNEFDGFNSVIKKGNPQLFRLAGYSNAKTVYLSGSFNNWRRDELLMNKLNDGWELPYVLGPGNHEYVFIVDGKAIADPAGINMTSDDKSSSLVLSPNHIFRLKGFDDAKKIYIAGDFNNWAPASLLMKKMDGEWIMPVHLSPGKHLYKFIVDGKWIIDPDNKLWEQNEHDTGNSVIWVE